MIIYPAIDLIDGQCVRLRKGDYSQQTTYASSPVEVAQGYARAGASTLHVIDLEGARDGTQRQTSIIAQIMKSCDLVAQVGGGIRSEDDVQRLLDVGVHRVIVGSLAIKEPQTTARMFERFGGEHLVLALDARIDEQGVARVATAGWTVTETITVQETIKKYEKHGLQSVLCTDIDRDGMLEGPHFDLYTKLSQEFTGLEFVASGGIGKLDDLRALKLLAMQSAVVGKALYENVFTLQEALTC